MKNLGFLGFFKLNKVQKYKF